MAVCLIAVEGSGRCPDRVRCTGVPEMREARSVRQGLDPLGATENVDGVKDDIGSVAKVQLLVELLSELREFVVHITIIESSAASFKSQVSLSKVQLTSEVYKM